MRRLAVLILAFSLLLPSPASAHGQRHRHGRTQTCHLLGIAVTDGGDTGEPFDIWWYAYRCDDGTRHESPRIVPKLT